MSEGAIRLPSYIPVAEPVDWPGTMDNILDIRTGGRRSHEDLAAERAVLGAVLADNTLIDSLAEVVHQDDFASPAHAQIFAAMLKLSGSSRQVDHLTLAEELKVLGQLAAVGGPAYLMSLDQVVPVPGNAVQYAKIVKDQALRRRLAGAGREIQELASQETGELDALLDEAERKVFLLAEKKRVGDLRPVSELMEHTLDLLDKMKTATTGITGLSTGYVDLDNQLTGLHGGELIILAARPGVGKTSFAMNIATHVGLAEDPKAAAIFSLEMPADQLLMRLLASSARVDMKKLRGGRLTPHDEEKFQEMAGKLYNAPIYIDDSGGLSPFDLRAKARRLKQRDPRLSLIIVDYLQLMHQKGKVESRQLEISEISRSLKQLAKELEVPIIALSQLSRKVEERKGGKPMLSDLRESGAIEQDADVVMFIHREDQGEAGEGGEVQRTSSAIPVQLVIAKQRNGPIGDIDLVFLAEYTRFESRARVE
jgi:replicative DNA helicase